MEDLDFDMDAENPAIKDMRKKPFTIYSEFLYYSNLKNRKPETPFIGHSLPKNLYSDHLQKETYPEMQKWNETGKYFHAPFEGAHRKLLDWQFFEEDNYYSMDEPYKRELYVEAARIFRELTKSHQLLPESVLDAIVEETDRFLTTLIMNHHELHSSLLNTKYHENVHNKKVRSKHRTINPRFNSIFTAVNNLNSLEFTSRNLAVPDEIIEKIKGRLNSFKVKSKDPTKPHGPIRHPRSRKKTMPCNCCKTPIIQYQLSIQVWNQKRPVYLWICHSCVHTSAKYHARGGGEFADVAEVTLVPLYPNCPNCGCNSLWTRFWTLSTKNSSFICSNCNKSCTKQEVKNKSHEEKINRYKTVVEFEIENQIILARNPLIQYHAKRFKEVQQRRIRALSAKEMGSKTPDNIHIENFKENSS